VPVEEAGQNLLDRVRTGLKNLFADLVTWLQSLRDRLNRSE